MVEASPVKFYFAKYFFLGFAFLQWLACVIIFAIFPIAPKSFFACLVFFTLGMLFVFLFSVVAEKIRRVAVGKNKIVVIEGDRNTRFEWPEVKSLKLVPFFHLYRLKIRGKKGAIYFFPSHNIDPAFGLLTKDPLVEKKKKEFGIK